MVSPHGKKLWIFGGARELEVGIWGSEAVMVLAPRWRR